MLNIIYPIYDNVKEKLPTSIEDIVKHHIDNWRNYSPNLRQYINIIVVDDPDTPTSQSDYINGYVSSNAFGVVGVVAMTIV